MIDQQARQRLFERDNNKGLVQNLVEKFNGISQAPKSHHIIQINRLTKISAYLGELITAVKTFKINWPKIFEVKGKVSVDKVEELPSISIKNFAELGESFQNLGQIFINLQKTAPKFPTEIAIKKQPPVTINNLSELEEYFITLQEVITRTLKNPEPIAVKNFTELQQYFGQITTVIMELEKATVNAIKSSKITIPSSFQVKNPVQIVDFNELLDGIEELKKGFNLLINKEASIVGFPDKTIPVEIQNWMIPQPVTNVSLNPNRGTVLATSITVTASLTPLPGTALADRRSMTIYNNSSSTTIFVGGANVTAASGIPVPAGTYGPSLDAGPLNIVYAVTSSGSADVRVLEMNDLVAGGDN